MSQNKIKELAQNVIRQVTITMDSSQLTRPVVKALNELAEEAYKNTEQPQ